MITARRASGVPTEIRFPVVYTIRDGRIVRGFSGEP